MSLAWQKDEDEADGKEPRAIAEAKCHCLVGVKEGRRRRVVSVAGVAEGARSGWLREVPSVKV